MWKVSTCLILNILHFLRWKQPYVHLVFLKKRNIQYNNIIYNPSNALELLIQPLLSTSISNIYCYFVSNANYLLIPKLAMPCASFMLAFAFPHRLFLSLFSLKHIWRRFQFFLWSRLYWKPYVLHLRCSFSLCI